ERGKGEEFHEIRSFPNLNSTSVERPDPEGTPVATSASLPTFFEKCRYESGTNLHSLTRSKRAAARAMFGSLRFVLGLRLQPLVRLLLRLFFLNAVALLQAAHKLVLASGHEFQVVVGEFAPLLPDHALHLLPLAFHLIPVHNFRLARVEARACPECR